MSDGQARLTKLAGWQFAELAREVVKEVEIRGGEEAGIGKGLAGGVARHLAANARGKGDEPQKLDVLLEGEFD